VEPERPTADARVVSVPARPSGRCIEENIQRSDPPIPDDDHIRARVFGRSTARAGAPSQATGIMETLRFTVRGVSEVRVSRAEISRELVQCIPPDEFSRWHVELTVFGIELLDGGTTTGCIAFAEDLLEVAIQQLMSTVGHDLSP
jgi:hypothetical protein